eukprot:CFRG7878T1
MKNMEATEDTSAAIPLIDAHCHLQMTPTSKQLDSILTASRSNNICQYIVNSTCESDWQKVAQLANIYKLEVLPAFGIHPWWAGSVEAGWLERLEHILLQTPNASVGEIGLDKSRKGNQVSKNVQTHVFEKQLRLAKKLNRPVSVHCTKSYGSILQYLRLINKEFPGAMPLPSWCLLHGYQGPPEMVNDLVSAGAVFSFGVYMIQTPSDKQIKSLRAVPLDYLLLETDCPSSHTSTDPSFLVELARVTFRAVCISKARSVNIH